MPNEVRSMKQSIENLGASMAREKIEKDLKVRVICRNNADGEPEYQMQLLDEAGAVRAVRPCDEWPYRIQQCLFESLSRITAELIGMSNHLLSLSGKSETNAKEITQLREEHARQIRQVRAGCHEVGAERMREEVLLKVSSLVSSLERYARRGHVDLHLVREAVRITTDSILDISPYLPNTHVLSNAPDKEVALSVTPNGNNNTH